MKLYLASQSQYRDEIAGITESLRRREYDVNSTWPWLDPNSTAEDETTIWADILRKITAADLLIVIPMGPEPLRGALVEVGMALACGTKVIITGEHEAYGTWQFADDVVRYYDLPSVLRHIDEGDL